MDQKKILRESKKEFEKYIKTLYPDKAIRFLIFDLLNQTINEIHQVEPSAWGITVYPHYIRLNVGGVEGLTLSKNQIDFLATGRILKRLPWRYRSLVAKEVSYNFTSDIQVYSLRLSKLNEFEKFKDAHYDALIRSAQKRRKYFWPDAHSPGVIKFLRGLGYKTQNPDYSFVRTFNKKEKTIIDLDVLNRITTEGRKIIRQHLAFERDPKQAQLKKEYRLKKQGKLICEVCEFDFEKMYGPIGYGFAEVHHLKPLSKFGEQLVNLDDLAIVCSNCHRMLHRGNPVFSLKELKLKIKNSQRN